MDLAESLSPHSRLRYSAWFQVRRLKPSAIRLVAFGTVAVLMSKMGSPSLVLCPSLTVPQFPLVLVSVRPVSVRSCFRWFLFPFVPVSVRSCFRSFLFPLVLVSARSCFRSFLFPLSPRFITAADCGEAVIACSRLRSWRITMPHHREAAKR